MLGHRRLEGALVALGALVLASAASRFVLSRGVAAPWISPDEPLYGLLGRSLASGDGYRILGETVPYYSILYPLLVGPLLLGHDLAAGVTDIQALQALLMSATAVPVYLWARPLAGARWGLVAAALAVLIPGLVYSGLLMSEALYYPVATAAAWALAACLSRPTLARQGLLLGAIGLAVGTRLQAVGFIAAVIVALALLAAAERSTAPFRRMLPTVSVFAAVAVAWLASRLVLGGFGGLLGAYAPVAEAGSYSAAEIGRSISRHVGVMALLTVAIPLVALGVLAWETFRGRERDPRVRALVVTAVAYTAVTVVEVGAFASRFVGHVTERQLLSLAPVTFVVLTVWLARGAPRPQPATSILTVAIAVPVLLLPLDQVAIPEAAPDAPSTIPLEELGRHLSEGGLEALYAVAAAAVLALAVFVPRRAAPALAGLVALVLATGSLLASFEVRTVSKHERESQFAGMRPAWIDESGATDAALLYTGDRPWTSVWQQLFWNESISGVARSPASPVPGTVPQTTLSPRFDGRVYTAEGTAVAYPYLVAPAGVSIVGEQIATLPPSIDQPGLAVWRVEPPLRISQWVSGLKPNGDLIDAVAQIYVFDCGPGRLELTLLGKEGHPTRILREGRVVAERSIPPGGVWHVAVPAPANANGSTRCLYELQSEGLVGSTRIEFVPA